MRRGVCANALGVRIWGSVGESVGLGHENLTKLCFDFAEDAKLDARGARIASDQRPGLRKPAATSACGRGCTNRTGVPTVHWLRGQGPPGSEEK